MDKEKVYNEAVGGDEGFAAGDGYPSCDGEPCANVTDESSADADTMAGDRNTPKAASEELPSRDWEAEIAEWQDKYLRLQAEFDNFRKRTLREKMELVQSGSAECVKNFLPLMDDLQRALEAIEKSNDLEALREGVKLIAQKFRETLKKQNVKEIEALGLDLLAEKMQITRDEVLAKLKENYDGYHFTWPSPDIYNPFSLFNAFNDGKFNSYWFGSGTPTYLIEMLNKFGVLPSEIGGIEAVAAEFDAPTERMTSITPLLYQSGYITIKGYDSVFDIYTLDIPNKEVRIGLMRNLIPSYITNDT